MELLPKVSWWAILSAFVLCAICLLFLAGCGGIRSGEVLDHHFYPAHDKQDFIVIGDIMMPQTNHIPDRWYVTIGRKCEEGYYCKNQIQVTKECYDRLKKGDWADFNQKD